jgi:hypothetical protein
LQQVAISELVSLDMKFSRTAELIASLAIVGACATPSPLPDPLEAGWNGVPVCEKLHEDSKHRVLRCSFPPLVGHERHFHSRHFGYAVAGGRVRITDSSGTREVDPATGSSFASDGVDWHEVLNVGDSTVVYLIIEPK